MSFQAVLYEHFSGAVAESEFVAGTLTALSGHGFTADNAIACVAVCRDELCSPLQLEVRNVWGEAFDMASLAGVTFCGVTGFRAAQAHAPTAPDRERHVYFSMAHIGIGPGGELGQCTRVGRAGTSVACGALAALLNELQSGQVSQANLEHDPDDIEQSLLRQRLLQRLDPGAEPDLIALTQAARREALATLERMIELTTDRDESDYAVFNGVQIHGPAEQSLIWNAVSYAMVGGARVELVPGR